MIHFFDHTIKEFSGGIFLEIGAGKERKRNRKGAGPKEHKRCMNLPTPCARDSPLFRSLSSLSCAGVQKVLEPVAGDGPGRLEL